MKAYETSSHHARHDVMMYAGFEPTASSQSGIEDTLRLSAISFDKSYNIEDGLRGSQESRCSTAQDHAADRSWHTS